MEGDNMVQHHVYCWVVKNVYLCEKLLSSSIEGPPFRKSTSECISTLQLGQGAESKEDGIRLFIKPTSVFKDVVLNFNVSIREQMDSKPFFNTKFQEKFYEGFVWSSPVISNEEFKQKFVTNQKLSRFWDIRVELVWNEVADSVHADCFPLMTTDLQCQREVGTDLKEYLYGQFSNTYIKIMAEETKAHKAVLQISCDYFPGKLNASKKSLVMADEVKVTDDPKVKKSVKVCLYTIDTPSQVSPLHIDVYQSDKLKKLYNLQWLTLPTEDWGITNVDSQTVDLEIYFKELEKDINKESLSEDGIESSKFGDRKSNLFTLLIKVTKDKSPHLSVFVKLASGEPSFVHLELSIGSTEKEAIFTKRTVGHLDQGCYLGIEEFISVETLMSNKEYLNKGTLLLICKITYSKGIVDTSEEGTFGKFILDIDSSGHLSAGKEHVYCETSNGCEFISEDLTMLLKTTPASSDCVVVVGEKLFHAHKVILTTRSSYFSEKISCDKMLKLDSANTSVIKITVDENIPDEHMNIILEEIYTGLAEIKDESIAEALYQLSKFFGLASLEEKCKCHMKAVQAKPDPLTDQLDNVKLLE